MSFDKLDDIEKKKMLDLVDDRSISENLLSAFAGKGGEFHEFKKYVDGKKAFAVCLRGNSEPECITIYHNNHVVWELSYESGMYGVKANYNHARYTSDWDGEEKLGKLKKYFGIEKDILPKKTGKNNAEMIYLKCKKEKGTKFFTQDFVEGTAKLLLSVMDDFFNPYLRYDYFKKFVFNEDYNKDDKTALVEKRWQQELFHHFKNTDNGIYVYDLEFSQKFPSSPDSEGKRKNTIKAKLEDVINEPDMLGIRFENGSPKSLVLIEVKSTYTACTNRNSGVEKHLKGMKNYSEEPFFVNNRRKEASHIFGNLKRMNCLDKEYDGMDFENLPIERLMIFTTDKVLVDGKIFSTEDGKEGKKGKYGSALKYYNENTVRVIRMCEDNHCSLWLVNGRNDEDYTIAPAYEYRETEQ